MRHLAWSLRLLIGHPLCRCRAHVMALGSTQRGRPRPASVSPLLAPPDADEPLMFHMDLP
jgi:hypothetical protein